MFGNLGNTITTGALDIDITVDVAALVNAVDNIKNLPENLKEIGKKIEAAGKAVVVAKEKLVQAISNLSAAEQKQVNEQVGAILLASNDKYYAVSLEADEEYRKELAKIPQSDYEARTELQTKHALKKNALEVQKLEKEAQYLEMALSKEGRDMLKVLEGKVVDKSGLHVTYLDSAKKPTIGYGHLIKDGEHDKFTNGINEEEATNLFKGDVKEFENYLNNNVTNSTKEPLKQNEFDALVMLTFNIGKGSAELQTGFAGSTVKKMLTEKNIVHGKKTPYNNLEDAWKAWNQAGGKVNDGLIMRRGKEWTLYSSGVYK